MTSAAAQWQTPYQRPVALLYGFVCHALFLAAILSAMSAMYHGMSQGWGPKNRLLGSLWDLALLFQFPVIHSFLLHPRGQRFLSALAPAWAAQSLSTTLFTMVASLQMLALYLLWSPLGGVWWAAHGWTKALVTLAYLASWLLLAKAMSDAGLAAQTGFLGWSSLFQGRKPAYGGMPDKGLFKLSRQPIYLGFALTVWTVPVWTPDQLCLALWFTSYCVFGPRMKEARYARRYGKTFDDYKARVPYFLPLPLRRRNSGVDPAA